MAKGHRTQIKRERNAVKDTRPSAKLSYARVSVSKACFVLDAIRGKSVDEAEAILMYNPRYASAVVLKLLRSAVANAENNQGLSREPLCSRVLRKSWSYYEENSASCTGQGLQDREAHEPHYYCSG